MSLAFMIMVQFHFFYMNTQFPVIKNINHSTLLCCESIIQGSLLYSLLFYWSIGVSFQIFPLAFISFFLGLQQNTDEIFLVCPLSFTLFFCIVFSLFLSSSVLLLVNYAFQFTNAHFSFT